MSSVTAFKKRKTEVSTASNNNNSLDCLANNIPVIVQKILEFFNLNDLPHCHLVSKRFNIIAKKANGLSLIRPNLTLPSALMRKTFWESPPQESLKRFTSVRYAFLREYLVVEGALSQNEAMAKILQHLPKLSSVEVVCKPFWNKPETSDCLLDLINKRCSNLTRLEFPGFLSPKEGQMTTVCMLNPKLTSVTIPEGRVNECLDLSELTRVRISNNEGENDAIVQLIQNNPNLSSITIIGRLNFDVMDSLRKHSNLRELFLEITERFTLSHLPSTLESLTIRSHESANNLFLDSDCLPILFHLKHLELINIKEADVIAILYKCPNLISLSIFGNISNLPKLLDAVNKGNRKVLQKCLIGFYEVNLRALDKHTPLNNAFHYYGIDGQMLSLFNMPELLSLQLLSLDIRELIVYPENLHRESFTGYDDLKRRCPKLNEVRFFCFNNLNTFHIDQTKQKLSLLFKTSEFRQLEFAINNFRQLFL